MLLQTSPGTDETAPAERAPQMDDGAGAARREFPFGEPSDHHMRRWPLGWNAARGHFQRTCPHGVGHPDPDDIVYLQSVGGVSGAHPCDGCCLAPMRD
jgi:hypothetical protein